VKQNNPSLQTEALNEKISETRVRSAWASLLPQVRAFGTFDNNISLPVQLVPAQFLGGPEGEFAEVKFGTRYNAAYGAEASLPLINLSNWKGVSSALHAQKASEWQLEDRKLNVMEQAATAYYFALLSYEAITISKILVNAADSLLDAADIRLANGLIEPMEYNRVKAVQLESLQQLRAHQGSYVKNLNALKLLMGVNSSDTLLLTENISESVLLNSKPSELYITISSLPRYHLLSYKNLQAAEDAKRQRARVLPELSLFARYTKQSFSNEANMFANNQAWYDVGVVGLRAEWNLFTGFNRQASIRQSSLQASIAEQELKNFTLLANKESEELKINHQVAAHAVGRFIEHFSLNTENYRIAGEKYKQGVYTIDQYITIYQELVRSQNQYLNSLANYLVYESIINTRNTLKQL
jgi:outer membrane protein TolC